MTMDTMLEPLSHIYNSCLLPLDKPLSIIPVQKMVGAHHTLHNPAHGVLITGIKTKDELTNVISLLAKTYPGDQPVCLNTCFSDSMTTEQNLKLGDLTDGRSLKNGQTLYLYVAPREKGASFEEFQEIIAHLRAPEGCPWDREQTHLSLRNNLLEEAYETLEAIDHTDMAAMREEFGDLLLQIVLHAQIASEADEFSMEDVIAGIAQKLIRRHPHVFGETEVAGVKNVLVNWEKLKQQERADNGTPEKGLLDGVPVGLPSLTQAQSLQDRAARVGFDWASIEPVWDKVLEELDEVKKAATPTEIAKELGDLLFAVVNLSRWFKVDAESALRGTNQKFRRRFKHIEKNARSTGKDLHSMSLDEMDVYWNEAKGME
ncbi:MAG: nucleoside triphosphate pyrophosphohydrolase [Leptolinea sp.]|nr:nucleoside triphosphate pyrophosphohydrolase [Leptolinea sp.]